MARGVRFVRKRRECRCGVAPMRRNGCVFGASTHATMRGGGCPLPFGPGFLASSRPNPTTTPHLQAALHATATMQELRGTIAKHTRGPDARTRRIHESANNGTNLHGPCGLRDPGSTRELSFYGRAVGLRSAGPGAGPGSRPGGAPGTPAPSALRAVARRGPPARRRAPAAGRAP